MSSEKPSELPRTKREREFGTSRHLTRVAVLRAAATLTPNPSSILIAVRAEALINKLSSDLTVTKR
jgi:hypothetical protein